MTVEYTAEDERQRFDIKDRARIGRIIGEIRGQDPEPFVVGLLRAHYRHKDHPALLAIGCAMATGRKITPGLYDASVPEVFGIELERLLVRLEDGGWESITPVTVRAMHGAVMVALTGEMREIR